VLRRMFGLENYDVTGEWRRLHNEELYSMYHSRNIIQVTESKKIKWTSDGKEQRCIHDFDEQT
jgi:hypothetical protein